MIKRDIIIRVPKNCQGGDDERRRQRKYDAIRLGVQALHLLHQNDSPGEESQRETHDDFEPWRKKERKKERKKKERK
jgi:hypothetical protein